MGTLYIDRKNIDLRSEGSQLCVYCEGKRQGTIPLGLVDRLVIHGQATFSSGVLTSLVEKGVALLVLSGRRNCYPAIIQGTFHGDTRRRIAQYRWHAEPHERLLWAARLVRFKLLSELKMLKTMQRARPDQRKPLFDGIETIERLLVQLKESDFVDSIATLNGIEGAAAAAYFAAISPLFPAGLRFRSRNRRPPKDPVNSVLSLVYTLLHFEAVNACYGAGLDPYIGFYHEPAHHRESLASDLIEPVRSRADLWIWRLFADRVLNEDMFMTQQDACLLQKKGRGIFYQRYEIFARPLRRLLRRYALIVARELCGNSP